MASVQVGSNSEIPATPSSVSVISQSGSQDTGGEFVFRGKCLFFFFNIYFVFVSMCVQVCRVGVCACVTMHV